MKFIQSLIILVTLVLSKQSNFNEKRSTGDYLLSFEKNSGAITLSHNTYVKDQMEPLKKISVGIPLRDVILTKDAKFLVIALKELNLLVLSPISQPVEEEHKNFAQPKLKRNSIKAAAIEISLDGLPLCMKEYDGKIFVLTNKNRTDIIDLKTKRAFLYKTLTFPFAFDSCSLSERSEFKGKLQVNIQSNLRKYQLDLDVPIGKASNVSNNLTQKKKSHKQKHRNSLNSGLTNYQIAGLIIAGVLGIPALIFFFVLMAIECRLVECPRCCEGLAPCCEGLGPCCESLAPFCQCTGVCCECLSILNVCSR